MATVLKPLRQNAIQQRAWRMSYPVLTATSDKRGSWVRGGVVLGMVERGGGGGGGSSWEEEKGYIPDQPMKDDEGRESRKEGAW